MTLPYHLPETFLVSVKVDQSSLFHVLEWLPLHSDGPKPGQHEGPGILDPLNDVPGGDLPAVLYPETL